MLRVWNLSSDALILYNRAGVRISINAFAQNQRTVSGRLMRLMGKTARRNIRYERYVGTDDLQRFGHPYVYGFYRPTEM